MYRIEGDMAETCTTPVLLLRFMYCFVQRLFFGARATEVRRAAGFLPLCAKGRSVGGWLHNGWDKKEE